MPILLNEDKQDFDRFCSDNYFNYPLVLYLARAGMSFGVSDILPHPQKMRFHLKAFGKMSLQLRTLFCIVYRHMLQPTYSCI